MALLYDAAAHGFYVRDGMVQGLFIDPVYHRIQAQDTEYTTYGLSTHDACSTRQPLSIGADTQRWQTCRVPRNTSSSSAVSQTESTSSSLPSLSSCTTISLPNQDDRIVSSRDIHVPEKGRCPHPQCGKVFKDLQAHMLSHQAERPVKCPVLTCEYHQKGFARKYDANRHTLTHYKGTMVCIFCPGSTEACARTFSRADVFKRHLTSVHEVEQRPPNSTRSRASANTNRRLSEYDSHVNGTCSLCQTPFSNAQDFYGHLDDCVIRTVQEQENNNDCIHDCKEEAKVLQNIFERNLVDVCGSDAATSPSNSASRPRKDTFTLSKGGVPLIGKGRKKRKHYPQSWGLAGEKMNMKKRVLCVYDGERKLWKEDMLSHEASEMRLKIMDGDGFIMEFDLPPLESVESLPTGSLHDYDTWNRESLQEYASAASPSQNVVPITKAKACGSTQRSLLVALSEVSRATSTKTPDTGPEKGGDGNDLVLRLDGCATTPCTTDNDDNRRSRHEGDDALESEGELSFMATPRPGDLQLESDGPSNSLRSILQNTVAQQISNSYTTLLLRGRGAGAQNTESSGSSNFASSSTSGAKSSSTPASSPLSVKKRSCTDDENDHDENDEPPRKRPSARREYGAANDGKLLACPYSKFDPGRYSERNTTEMQYRNCSSCFLTSIPRLKQHLYRVHSRPKHYCSCCFESFETALLLDAHARARSCTVSPSHFDEKMTVDQMTEIKRRTPREERTKSWFAIYRILFPHAALPTNPFVGNYPEECVEHFLGYFEHEAPGILTNAIRSELNASALLLGSEQRRLLDDILEISLSRVASTMTNAARERWDAQQEEGARPPPDMSSSPNPSRTLSDYHSRHGHSSSPSQQAGVPPKLEASDLSQDDRETTQPWLLVRNTTAQDHYPGQSNVATTISSVDDALPLLSISPEGEHLDGIDHNMASEEWQQLLNDTPPLEFWHDGRFYPDDKNISSADVHSTMGWFS